MDNIKDFEVNSPRWLSLEDFEGEVWKDIPGYEGCYQASNLGRIKSLDRYIKCGKGDRIHKGCIKQQALEKTLYYIVRLSIGCKKKNKKVHRLVALAFLPNPSNLPVINHKNEIKTDNNVDNLEWCTILYNSNYGTGNLRKGIALTNNPGLSLPVYQYTLDGKFLKKYPSAKEAERCTGIKSTNILSVCRGTKSSSTGGFIWSHTMDPMAIKSKVNRKKNGLKQYGEKKVCQYTLDGRFIKEYNSITEAAEQTTARRDTISACCRHVNKYHSAGGYKWEYSDAPDKEERVKQKVPIRPKRKTF